MAAGAAALLGSGTALCRFADVERLYAQMSPTQTPCRMPPAAVADPQLF
jgi:hypothetical protein